MTFPHQGEILSVLAAFAWAFAVILFRLSGRSVAPFALNFFKNTLGLVLFLITLAVVRLPLVRDVPAGDYIALALSGVIGLAIADTLFLKSLNIVGAGLTQVVGCTYSPFVIIFSTIFLGERLTAGDAVGALLILSGVFLSSRHKPPDGVTRKDLIRGIILGVIAFSLMALGVVIAKPALGRSPVLWSTTIRLFAGVAALALISATTKKRRNVWRSFKPNASWRIAIPASVVGTYFAMMLWLGGMKYTQASTASILNQSSAVFVLPLAALLLHEPITRLKIMAVALAVGGVALVTLA